MSDKVITRFAPSPTGLLHAGNYRTAVFTYLFTRKLGGEFILRVEDTDRLRSKKECTENIIESLKWLGLEYDKYALQSESINRHKEVLTELINKDAAYVSHEKHPETGADTEVIRFRNPGTDVTFQDLIRGEITMHTGDLGDFVIAKSISEPLFHLSVVVDDFDMGITHVTRGEDHISNTPRQILIQRALGAPTPVYAHLPLLLGTDRSKLSKRKGAKAMTEYRDLGYLPETLINYMALLGWNPGTDQELFTKGELIESFSFERVQKSAAIFDETKLDWLNREHMKRLSESELLARAKDFIPAGAEKFLPLLLERINKFGDIPELLNNGGELDFLISQPKPSRELLIGKSGATESEIKNHLNYILEKGIEREVVWPYAEQMGKGKVLWPMRVALSGREKSPDPLSLVKYLGEKEALNRIKSALAILG
ncbi:MAG TPA: glutamate--tRNA ligase family protein [Candidatus Paceibacterota bacterium]